MPNDPAKPFRLAIAGLGTVGAEVARHITGKSTALHTRTNLQLVAVSARNKNKDRGFPMDGIEFHPDPITLAKRDDIDAVVELIGGDGSGVALEVAEAALTAGHHLITANKALLAHHGKRLAEMAEAKNLALAGEAAVAGGIPIIKMMKESLAANNIHRITAILNGTCNYILSTMQHQACDFNETLADAQKLGYAEADPSFDIEGLDAAHKIALLASLAFGTTPNIKAMPVAGITNISLSDMTCLEGHTIRLLAEAVRLADGGVHCRVAPVMLPLEAELAKIDGPLNAVTIKGDPIGSVTIIGPGAGAGATASAVLADIIDVAQGHITGFFGVPAKSLIPAKPPQTSSEEGQHFIRLHVKDKPGVLADITNILRQNRISVASIHQSDGTDNDGVAVNLATHNVASSTIDKAMAAIAQLPVMTADPLMMRIYND
ncbi:MAG: homoserine dehydrogenase [Proteobacteria bacterium]|nr:homoserine dehydrogenase [Pseudomonadota bacterium]